MAEARRADPYKASFDRCGDGSTILSDQQWVRFLDLLVDTNFLNEVLAERFKHEHESQPHSFELFQRDLCNWVGDLDSLRADGIIDELKQKTHFLRQVVDAQRESDPIDASFLKPVIRQAEGLRERLAGIEEATYSSLASKWAEADLFGSTDDLRKLECGCPWKFQQANARYLRVEDRQRARYQFRLHQCDESADRVLKETFYPVLQQFCEVQVGMAMLYSRKQGGVDEDDSDPELAVAVMVRRQSASEEALLWLDNLVSAYRQLSLSPYVQQYLGSEEVSGTKQEALVLDDDATTRYYFEFVQARSLSEVLQDDGVLCETSPLFKLYARELLLAILDLMEQTSHHLNSRLLPDQVMISHSGRRLFLGKLDFGDQIHPCERAPSAQMQNRERSLLQDLAVVIFSMLYPITLPRNLQEFRTQYLGRGDSKFVFRYRINCKVKSKRPKETAVCVSCGDTFATVLAGDNLFDGMWTCQISKSAAIVCVDRRYSPMEFRFRAESKGDCTITFSPLGRCAVHAFELSVTVWPDNLRLHQSRAQVLISTCAAKVEDAYMYSHRVSPRMLLHHHEYFQPLSKSESHEVDHELLDRV